METTKVYVHLDQTAVVRCPYCDTPTIHNVEKFKGGSRSVTMQCECQSAFDVCFEFRKTRRKETNIQGYFAKLPDVYKWKRVLITNISLAGIGLLTAAMHDVRIGDQLKVRFSFNGAGSPCAVEKEAVVRWVADGSIGCKFREPVRYDDSSLHFYLMP